MAWATPLYSKRQVDQAAVIYVDPAASAEERELALTVINNWRSCHSFPLNTFQMSLRRLAREVGSDPLVAQRIKRLSSIDSKLRRFPKLRLSQMQDIGGCRAVMEDVVSVEAVCDRYARSAMRHTLVRHDDYITTPKDSGYRGVHLVYRYVSDRKVTYNGLQIEIQVRSRPQHAWATAVETVGTFTQQALKSSVGEAEWLRFFALMSSEIARREDTSRVPNTPETSKELRREIREHAKRLDVVARLQAYGIALRELEHPGRGGSRYFVLELNVSENSLTIREYGSTELLRASEEYLAIERATADDPARDAVLVSVDSVAALRRAYPNYFADTGAFLAIVREVTS
jgi:ppGpp synthetase/RelA/SpoT-type nucleotidyltranferase